MQHFDDFAQMQRDAERRVMEMQRRAMAAVDSVEYPTQTNTPTQNDNSPIEIVEKHSDTPSEALNPLKKLGLSDEDSESMMLIIIILLLLREEADERLIFALLYILL